MKSVETELQNIHFKLAEAHTERDFQTVGTLCREVLITLAQIVYDPVEHGHIDEVETGKADANRMLEAYLTKEIKGSTNKHLRSMMRETLKLANHLQHKRTADFKHAAICSEMTSALINCVAVISGDTVQEDYGPGTEVELSENAGKLVKLLNTNSKNAHYNDPDYRLSEIMDKLTIAKEEAEEAVDELDELGLINIGRTLSDQFISPRNALFMKTDPVFREWNPVADAKVIAKAIVTEFQENVVDIKDLNNVLQWGPRRMNPAITYLVENGIVDSSDTLNPGPYKYNWIMVTAKTRRYAKEDS